MVTFFHTVPPHKSGDMRAKSHFWYSGEIRKGETFESHDQLAVFNKCVAPDGAGHAHDIWVEACRAEIAGDFHKAEKLFKKWKAENDIDNRVRTA